MTRPHQPQRAQEDEGLRARLHLHRQASGNPRGKARAGLTTVPPVSRREQIQMSQEEAGAFLAEERTVICATNGKDGFPHLMPLWFVVRDDELWAWTFAKSQKVRNLERDPRATLAGRGRERVPRAARCHAEGRRDDPPRHRPGGRARPRALQPLRRRRAERRRARDGRRAGAQARRAAVHRALPSDVGSPQARFRTSTDEGPHPLRRQGHAPAPDHPHERQAARACRQQARALLRHRGDGRGRHRGGRDHHRAGDRRRDPRGGGRRLAVRRQAHLRRAGRAARGSRTRR